MRGGAGARPLVKTMENLGKNVEKLGFFGGESSICLMFLLDVFGVCLDCLVDFLHVFGGFWEFHLEQVDVQWLLVGVFVWCSRVG